MDLDWVYLALPVDPGQGAAAVKAMDTLGIEGLSVTMPHKADVAKAVERLTPSAERLGVCNCVFRDSEGVLWGDNTDGDGLIRSLDAEGVDVEGTSIVVVGTGGAARSIVEAVGRHRASEVAVLSRSPQNTMGELTGLCPKVYPLAANSVAQYDIIINASPVGMDQGPDPRGVPIETDQITSSQVVVDIVYEPRQTQLLYQASRHGAKTINGVGMLVYQAAAQFEHWTGLDAPIEVMRQAGFEAD